MIRRTSSGFWAANSSDLVIARLKRATTSAFCLAYFSVVKYSAIVRLGATCSNGAASFLAPAPAEAPTNGLTANAGAAGLESRAAGKAGNGILANLDLAGSTPAC